MAARTKADTTRRVFGLVFWHEESSTCVVWSCRFSTSLHFGSGAWCVSSIFVCVQRGRVLGVVVSGWEVGVDAAVCVCVCV